MWQRGACLGKGVYVAKVCVCSEGGMHGKGCVWVARWGAFMQERWPLRRAVRILLECILVST